MSEHSCDDPTCRYCRLTLRPPTQECEDYQRDNSFERSPAWEPTSQLRWVQCGPNRVLEQLWVDRGPLLSALWDRPIEGRKIGGGFDVEQPTEWRVVPTIHAENEL